MDSVLRVVVLFVLSLRACMPQRLYSSDLALREHGNATKASVKACPAAPPGPPARLELSGAMFQVDYMGEYRLVDGREVHGMPVWKHARDDHWIARTEHGWAVQLGVNVGQNEMAWLRVDDTSVDSPSLSPMTWHEYDNDHKLWKDSPSLKASMLPPLPRTMLRVEGARFQTDCNGVYHVVDGREVYGKAVWKHTSNDRWIARTAGAWVVQKGSKVGVSTSAYAKLFDPCPEDPHLSTTVWKEFSNSAKRFLTSTSLKCTVVPSLSPSLLRLSAPPAFKKHNAAIWAKKWTGNMV